MKSKELNCAEAEKLIATNEALIIDVRNPDEYANEHIPFACSIPMEIAKDKIKLIKEKSNKKIILQCKSGDRAKIVCEQLTEISDESDFYILAGGLDSWKKEVGDIISLNDKSTNISIMRQVQIIAGTIILLGVILGFIHNTNWYYLSGFVGLGLAFAGLTGFCGMAVLLSKMPWNKAGCGKSCQL